MKRIAILLAIGIAIAAVVSVQTAMSLPALVARDSNDQLIGQIVTVGDFVFGGLGYVVAIRQDNEKVLLQVLPDHFRGLGPHDRVYYTLPNCEGSPRLSFKTSSPDLALRGVVHGVGVDGLVYRADENSLTCVGGTGVQSNSSASDGGCSVSQTSLAFCKEAEATSIDLGAFLPPFRVE